MLDEINKVKDDIRDYIEVKFDLLRLQIAENLSGILSKTATLVILGYLLFFILLFLSLAAGFYCATLLGSNEAGFLCVAGFYGLVLILFLLLKKKIVEKPIIKAIVRLLFPKTGDNEK
ncbi:MAG TPA: phage holin family protein [Bacteroidales bacterium]|nr:phage holin family protein [Bacteroidales bacterium]